MRRAVSSQQAWQGRNEGAGGCQGRTRDAGPPLPAHQLPSVQSRRSGTQHASFIHAALAMSESATVTGLEQSRSALHPSCSQLVAELHKPQESQHAACSVSTIRQEGAAAGSFLCSR